jgi:hypothetical protein
VKVHSSSKIPRALDSWEEVKKKLRQDINEDVDWQMEDASNAYIIDPTNWARVKVAVLKEGGPFIADDPNFEIQDRLYGEFFQSEDYQKFKFRILGDYQRMVEQALRKYEPRGSEHGGWDALSDETDEGGYAA